MAKRTKALQAMVDEANRVMRVTPDSYREGRKAVFDFTCTFLHRSGSYKGFNYLDAQSSVFGEASI